MAAMLCFALNPGLVYDSVIWGQNDTALALPMLAGALLICERRYLLGWSAAAFAMLIKPQAMAMYPPLAVATLLDTEVREWFVLGLLFVAVVAITIAPFQAGHPPRLFFDLYGTLAARYHAGSMNTLNFLALGDLNQPDAKRVPIIGISYFYFGMALLAALYAAVSIQIARARGRDNFMLTIAVTLLGWVMFAPRMHERYFFCPLVFLIAVALDSWILIAAMVWLSATFLWNLVMVYPPFGPVAHVPTTYRTLMAAFLNFVAFVAVAWVCFARSASSPAQGEQTNSLAPEASTQLGGARIL
jgi:Gpi18-like mannosyltransferase